MSLLSAIETGKRKAERDERMQSKAERMPARNGYSGSMRLIESFDARGKEAGIARNFGCDGKDEEMR